MSGLLFALLVIWIALFVVNIQYCLKKKAEVPDLIFFTGDYTRKGLLHRIELLEGLTGKKEAGVRRVLEKCSNNARKSRRKMSYYYRYLEPMFLSAMTRHDGGYWEFFWKRSSRLLKAQFFYMLLIPLFFFLMLMLGILAEVPEEYYLALPAFILATIIIMGFTIMFNTFCFVFIMWVLESSGTKSGVLNKNVVALQTAMESLKLYKKTAIVLGIAGMFKGMAGKGFKGLGGGKFGGGGASGSW